MQNTEFTSDKKSLSTLGYIVIGFVLIYSVVSIPSNNIVEKFPQFFIIVSIFLIFGISLIIIGNQKRKFVFSDNSISFVNHRNIVFEANYSDIDLIRIFHHNSSHEIVLGIVKSDDTTFSLTNSFFSNEMFYKVILKFKEIAEIYNIGFENEIDELKL